MPTRQRAQLIQNHALTQPARTSIPDRDRLVTALRSLNVNPINGAYRHPRIIPGTTTTQTRISQ